MKTLVAVHFIAVAVLGGAHLADAWDHSFAQGFLSGLACALVILAHALYVPPPRQPQKNAPPTGDRLPEWPE